MPLYRALYVQDNRPHRFTIAAPDPQQAETLAQQLAPAPVLTLAAVASRLPAASQIPLILELTS